MHVFDTQKFKLKAVVSEKLVVPSNGHKGRAGIIDQGTVELTLECGHTKRMKKSQHKAKSYRCPACGLPANASPRQVLDPLGRLPEVQRH